MFFPRRRAEIKRFSYEPRYYDPTHEENLKQRLRIKSSAYTRRQSPARLLLILALLVMALYIFLSV